MAKYGLGQIDLNQRACVALMGLTQDPAVDLIALLRSSQPIDPVTRLLLANTLAGKSDKVTARITRKAGSNGLQKFRKRLERLHSGRRVQRERDERGYTNAVGYVAENFSAGGKSIEASLTFVRKIDSWMASFRSARPDLANFTDRELETAYLYAEAFGLDPDEACNRSLPLLTRLIDHWRDLQEGIGELGEDWMTP